MIKMIILDIDGVITDGTILLNEDGYEQKKINLKDIDAIFELKSRGFKIAAITGEQTNIVNYFENRFPWDYFFKGKKNKLEIIHEIENVAGINKDEICYIGDGKYDVEPIGYVGLGICPSDAVDRAKNASDIVLNNKGGHGCVWELISILDNYNNKNNKSNYFHKRLEEHNNVFKNILLDTNLINDVMKIADDIVELLQNKSQIFLCGNGGSAADAQHIATEFVSRFYKERIALNAEALTVNTSSLTAIGNDYNFDKVFTRQLEAKGRKGDILIGISTSGKSNNVVDALRYAKENGIKTCMLMGSYENDELSSICDYIIKVPSKVTPRIQEAHIFIGHLIAEYVEEFFSN